MPVWLWPNVLGLDAAIVALAWQNLFSTWLGLHLSLVSEIALALAAWAVYLSDRLLDARRPAGFADAARHDFCRHHLRAIGLLLGAVLFTGSLIVVSSVRRPLVIDSLPVAGAVLLYLAFVHSVPHSSGVRPPKEFAVALLFVAGAILAPWTRTSRHLLLAVAGTGFFVACLANTVAIQDFEWERLRRRRAPVLHRSVRWLARHFVALSVGSLACCAAACLDVALSPIFLAVSLAVAALLALHLWRDRFPADAYRVLADLALLSPLPILLLRRL